MSTGIQATPPSSAPRWRPLEATERRVLGVLIEKAKTTPENYPLSPNSVRTACNQKTNRAPLMQLDEDQVAEALENLRQVGAVSEIQGDGRVFKYRHLAYEWLGVDKVELAVMAELLLRGSQTVGELRGRAARMEPIKDLGQLQPILDSLLAKGLVLRLTPAGRGSVVTHALYLAREMDKVRREASTLADAPGFHQPALDSQHDEPRSADRPQISSPAPAGATTLAMPHDELPRLRAEVETLRSELQVARAEFEATAQQLRRDLDDLNRQLGN